MSNFILISGLLIGFLSGYLGIIPEFSYASTIFHYILYFLLFFIGVGVGSNNKIWSFLKKVNFEIILIPVSTIIGTFIGILPLKLIINVFKFKEIVAVSFGFGYYSLASIIISNNFGYTIGLLALISNLLRESFTILLSPILVKLFGKLAPILSGGATSMDTTLPSIVKSSGKEYAALSIFNGFVLTILVPMILPFISRLN